MDQRVNNPMYDSPFSITAELGNNAFSFEKRTNPTLFVPKLVEGDLKDVAIGHRVAFEDFEPSTSSGQAENGILKSCVGLRNFVRMKHPRTGKPIIIVDNHNHAFYFWHEALAKGQIEKGATLVHIDQHKDMRKPDGSPSLASARDGGPLEDFIEDPMDKKWLRKIFEYTNSVLNVGNYIIPAMEDGLIRNLISITSEADLIAHQPKKAKSLIVNVDLDFWAPEMDYIDPKLKSKKTKEWMEAADLITIATSPFFIDQTFALRILRDLIE
jgi:hypothetical protein